MERTVSLTFTGEDVAAILRLIERSRGDGEDPASDAATIIELFLDGDLVMKKP